MRRIFVIGLKFLTEWRRIWWNRIFFVSPLPLYFLRFSSLTRDTFNGQLVVFFLIFFNEFVSFSFFSFYAARQYKCPISLDMFHSCDWSNITEVLKLHHRFVGRFDELRILSIGYPFRFLHPLIGDSQIL